MNQEDLVRELSEGAVTQFWAAVQEAGNAAPSMDASMFSAALEQRALDAAVQNFMLWTQLRAGRLVIEAAQGARK